MGFLKQNVPADGSTIETTDQVIFSEAILPHQNEEVREEEDEEEEEDGEAEDGASSGDEKMLIIPGDVDGAGAGVESQMDG